MSQDQTGIIRSSSGIELSFSASLENVEVFIAGIHDFLAEKSLGGLAFDMELFAREALVNAVIHGSSSAPTKLVHASLRLNQGVLELVVRDDGPGWDWRSLPTELPDPVRESGRRLFIIRKYADSLTYNDLGNTLTITKRVPSEVQDMNSLEASTFHMTLEARLAAQDVPALRDIFRSRIQDGGRLFELDCDQLEVLDSMGIGLLVATHNSLTKLGGALKLTGVKKDIQQLLTLMRLDKYISITPGSTV